jgi:hypothetical protein
MPIFLNMKMRNKTSLLYTFQDENESENIWDKKFSSKSFVIKNIGLKWCVTKKLIPYVFVFNLILKSI